MSRLRPSRDAGMSLVELLVGSMVAIIVVAIVTAYVTGTARIDRTQEADLDAVDEMMQARTRLVRELRFARSVSSPATNEITVWLDNDGSGGTGPDAAGEDVTWRLDAGALVRFEDGNSAASRVWASGLDTSASTLSLAGGTVSLVLTTQVDRGFTTASRTLRGSVTVRNAP